ncbi:MAG: hypothetical protein N838_12915 [Thiohalocapsa sp. PB-PSB1]|jgi:thioesterase domain-containing protein|nr:MAG: hypothetical protein N838_12915 [Thiohalocapsa sp. PB-PSB1]HCS92867.1 hypothetical protein [Chromatiaceae bacterium]
MNRPLFFVPPPIVLAVMLCMLALPWLVSAQETPRRMEASPELPTPSSGSVPRWLEEVRAQRRALQQQRRVQHKARRRAIDPQGSAKQEARREAFLRRRQQTLEKMDQDRRLFMNQYPWTQLEAAVPLFEPPTHADKPPMGSAPDDHGASYPLPDWNNGWYYRGW